MSTIEFDESKFKLRSRRVLGEPEVPALIKFLVVKGIVKSESQAIGVLLVFIGALIMVSIFIGRSSGTVPATLDSEYISMSTVYNIL